MGYDGENENSGRGFDPAGVFTVQFLDSEYKYTHKFFEGTRMCSIHHSIPEVHSRAPPYSVLPT